jgi:RNA polymerase sigma-70 factor (ECF subfamily)
VVCVLHPATATTPPRVARVPKGTGRIPASARDCRHTGDSMDKPTFGEILSQHASWTRVTLLRLGVPQRDLQDVVQEVWRAVARGLPAFDPSLAAKPEGAVTGWLFGICERQAKNQRRTRYRRAEALRDTSELDGIDSPSPSPEDRYMACERTARLYDVLETIEPARRAVIVAYELEGMAMADVAVTLGIRINTAWNRLRLARADIRAAWDRPRRRPVRTSRAVAQIRERVTRRPGHGSAGP